MENMNFFQIRPLRSVCPGWYIKRLPQLSVNKWDCRGCGHQTGGEEKSAAVSRCSDFRVRVAAPKSFDSAQVCCGGVALQEVDEQFMSRRCHGLYLAGELFGLRRHLRRL